MYNKLVQQQLDKVKEADLSNYDPEKGVFIIKKKEAIRFLENQCYIIQVDKELINNNKTLLANWNRGFLLSAEYYLIDIHQVLGNMLKVSGIVYNIETKQTLNTMWEGWLPTENIKIIERIS